MKLMGAEPRPLTATQITRAMRHDMPPKHQARSSPAHVLYMGQRSNRSKATLAYQKGDLSRPFASTIIMEPIAERSTELGPRLRRQGKEPDVSA